jgi:transposase
MEDEDLEDEEEEEDVEDEEIDPEYDEDGNPIEAVKPSMKKKLVLFFEFLRKQD